MLALLVATAPVEGTAASDDGSSVQLPAQCAVEGELHARVALHLGEDWRTRVEAPTEVVLQLEPRHDGRFNAELRLRTREGATQRNFAVQDCDAALDATALIVAIAADPIETTTRIAQETALLPPAPEPAEATLEELLPPEDPEPLPAQDPVLEPLPASEDIDRHAPPPARRDGMWRPSFAVAASGALGSHFAGPGGGVLGRFELHWTHLHAALQVGYWIPRDVFMPEREGEGAAIDIWFVGPQLCGVPRAGRFQFPLCAGASFGGIRARGLGGSLDGRLQARPWLSLELDARAKVELHPRVGAYLGLRGEIPLYAQPLEFEAQIGDSSQTVYSTPYVAVSGEIGLELRFP